MKIKDKKLFKEQMKTIIIAIVSIIITVIFAMYLKENGFESLFTTNLYREAFETNPNDLILISRMEVIIIIGIFALTIQELKYNFAMQKLEREEEKLCGYLLQY